MDNLEHSGIKGQKWGLRRFQNMDRTWTEAGKERYGHKGNSRRNWGDIANKSLDKSIKTKNGSISPAEDTIRKAQRIAEEGENIARTVHKTKRNPAVDNMSDQELRDRINRMNLEKQYSELTSADTSKGYSKVMDIISVSGSVLIAGAAATGIAANVKELLKHADLDDGSTWLDIPVRLLAEDDERGMSI